MNENANSFLNKFKIIAYAYFSLSKFFYKYKWDNIFLNYANILEKMTPKFMTNPLVISPLWNQEPLLITTQMVMTLMNKTISTAIENRHI